MLPKTPEEYAIPREDWFKGWNSIQHPSSDPAWCLVWESAAEAAWVTVWRAAEERRNLSGGAVARLAIQPSPRQKFQKAIGTVISLLPSNRQPQHSTAAEEKVHAHDSLAKIIPFKLAPEVLESLADDALKKAKAVSRSVEANLAYLARDSFDSTAHPADATVHMIKMIDRAGWERAFIAAWEKAWKHSWISAWLAVWESAAKEARRSGIEDGDALQKEPFIRDEIAAAHEKICSTLSSNAEPATNPTPADSGITIETLRASRIGTALSSQSRATDSSYLSTQMQPDVAYPLQQGRLMFKELHRLQHFSKKPTTVSHQDAMKITQLIPECKVCICYQLAQPNVEITYLNSLDIKPRRAAVRVQGTTPETYSRRASSSTAPT